MKLFAPSALVAALITLGSLNAALAQPSKNTQPMVKSKPDVVRGVDTLTSKAADDKTTKKGSG